MQNWAAKVILGGKKYWLPVVKRVQFKVLLLRYRCLNGSTPRYLTSLMSPHQPPRNLRLSRDVLKLNNKCSMFQTFLGWSVAAPQLWNHLPYEIRAVPSVNIFKSLLKTYLFFTIVTTGAQEHSAMSTVNVVERRNTNLMIDWFHQRYK